MLNNFFTIQDVVTAEITEKKSKFIATLFPITDEEDANNKLNQIRKIHRDARHNVFAYRLADGKERYSDDGEPSGTAGTPMINILRGENLCNVLVVVTRYFGGILLGTGGLVRAYSEATKEAVLKVNKKQVTLHSEYKVKVKYDLYSKVEYFCKTNDIKILNSEFSDIVILNIIVQKEKEDMFLNNIEEISDRTADVSVVNREIYA